MLMNLAFGGAALVALLAFFDWLRGDPSRPVRLDLSRITVFAAGILVGWVACWGVTP